MRIKHNKIFQEREKLINRIKKPNKIRENKTKRRKLPIGERKESKFDDIKIFKPTVGSREKDF